MPRIHIPEALRQIVIERATGLCEYFLLHQDDTAFTHPIDHILPIKHGGTTTSANLALACIDCNRYKGSDLASVDPQTGTIAQLYNPRREKWLEHFWVEGARISGTTAIGRATVYLLRLNDPRRVQQRLALIAFHRFPPSDRE